MLPALRYLEGGSWASSTCEKRTVDVVFSDSDCSRSELGV
jgi:hypothetical protein